MRSVLSALFIAVAILVAANAHSQGRNSTSAPVYKPPQTPAYSPPPQRSSPTPPPSPRPSFNDAARGGGNASSSRQSLPGGGNAASGSGRSTSSEAFRSPGKNNTAGATGSSSAFRSGGSTGNTTGNTGTGASAFKSQTSGASKSWSSSGPAIASKNVPNLREDFRKSGAQTGNWGKSGSDGGKNASNAAPPGAAARFPGCAPGDTKCQFNCSSGAWGGERCTGPKFDKPAPALKPRPGFAPS